MRDARRGRGTRRSPPPALDLSPRNARRRGGTARARRRNPPPASRGTGFNPLALIAGLAGSWTRPGLRLLVLCVEVGAALLLVTNPAFAAKQVEVAGIHHLSRAGVLGRSGVNRGSNVFLVTPQLAEDALRDDPYVRSVSIATALPDRVEITIEEWEPIGLIHRSGHDYLVNQQGTVLSSAIGAVVGPAQGQPHVEISWAAIGTMRAGDHAISGLLLQDLKSIQDAFPTAYGLTVKAIDLTGDQQLTLETREGPRILFGQMVTSEQVASLDAKLASLKALSSKVDLGHSKLDYVNLMNQNQPVTHVIPSPSPSPRPSPTPKK